jgi:adhesin transport system membrane fusion protein
MNPAAPPPTTPTIPALRAVRSPRPAVGLAWILGIFLAILPPALVFVPWQQTAAGTGRVVAVHPLDRQQNIEAPIEGRITAWLITEGSRVTAGQKIASITDNDPQLVDRLQAERDSVLQRLSASTAQEVTSEQRFENLVEARSMAIAAADQRVTMARERIIQAEQRAAATAAARDTARLNADRQKKLFAEGLAATRAVEVAELDLARTTTEAEQASSTVNAAKAELLSLQAERLRVESDADANLDAARVQVQTSTEKEASALGELARIEVRLSRQATQDITAPRDGRILRLIGGQGGEVVRPGDTLAVLVPDTGSPAVEIYVDGNDVSLISDHRRVRLQFEGWPAVQFSGWPGAAVGTFGGRVSLVDATADNSGKFRVVVVPDADEEPWPSQVRQGARANGWVLLDRVSAGWEIWRLFNGFPPVISDPTAKDASKDVLKQGRKR